MSWADHLFVLLLMGVYPVAGFFSYRKLKPMLAHGPPGLRRMLYRRNMLLQWVLAALAIGLWIGRDRSLASLGLGIEVGWSFVTGMAVVFATAIYFLLQWRRASESAEVRRRVKRQIIGAAELLPRTDREFQTFAGVAVTAGFCEEVLFRGFLMGYLASVTGSLWLAIALSSLFFGAGHAYQGVKGVAVTTLAGLGFACVYVFTGSLVYSMAIHALVDINAGVLGRMVFASEDQAAAATSI